MMRSLLPAGARTSEFKTWLTEIKKGISLTILIWLALCLIWFLVSAVVWLVDPYSSIVYWFKERPRLWWAVNVGLGIPCLFGFIVWARQELHDADFTSLQGKHGLSGILPMMPLVRTVMAAGSAWMWWRRNRPVRMSKSELIAAAKEAGFKLESGDE